MDVQEITTAGLVTTSQDIMCFSCSAPIVMDFGTMVSLMVKREENRMDSRCANPTDTTFT